MVYPQTKNINIDSCLPCFIFKVGEGGGNSWVDDDELVMVSIEKHVKMTKNRLLADVMFFHFDLYHMVFKCLVKNF